LPTRPLTQAELFDRKTYLALFQAGALHAVVQKIELPLVFTAKGWQVLGPTPAELVESRIASFVGTGGHTTSSGITTIRDEGVYRDTVAHSTTRQLSAFSGVSFEDAVAYSSAGFATRP
jgi:hypothetical protein